MLTTAAAHPPLCLQRGETPSRPEQPDEPFEMLAYKDARILATRDNIAVSAAIPRVPVLL